MWLVGLVGLVALVTLVGSTGSVGLVDERVNGTNVGRMVAGLPIVKSPAHSCMYLSVAVR